MWLPIKQNKKITNRIFEEIKCAYCNKLFIPRSSSNKTCSKECLIKYNIIKLKYNICAYCGKKFKHKTRKTCSDICYFKYVGLKSNKTKYEKNIYKIIGLKHKGKTISKESRQKMSISRKKSFLIGKTTLNKSNWVKGNIPWNKGLNKKTDDRIKKLGKQIKNKTFDEYYGKEKSLKIRNNISKTVSNLYININYKKKYKYNHTYFRSTWETKVAKWLDEHNIIWEYETKNCLFELNNGKHYIVDFYLPKENKFIEVKGFWNKSSIEKCQQFINKHGINSLIVIDESNINNINLNLLFFEITNEFNIGVDNQIYEIKEKERTYEMAIQSKL